ncbi:hypothetical protein CDAR_7921 [Caerostris darwini]|uniref:Uncharacterized protein n=1 Tax=Caerostris darwini TaxID=1538125 RepID=A0AAV4QFL9_9ARAC|nr:hypothetical protein CDAR_7921 [Caerostris darwini]
MFYGDDSGCQECDGWLERPDVPLHAIRQLKAYLICKEECASCRVITSNYRLGSHRVQQVDLRCTLLLIDPYPLLRMFQGSNCRRFRLGLGFLTGARGGLEGTED